MKNKLHTFLTIISLLLLNHYGQAQAGSLDISFSNDGKLTTHLGSRYDYAKAVAIQKDGKIVVAGTYTHDTLSKYDDFALIRYNIDGTVDTSFGDAGIVLTDFKNSSDQIEAIAIQKNGKIIVAGNSSEVVALACYETTGKLDATFGINGLVKTDIVTHAGFGYSCALDTNGDIVVVSWLFGAFDQLCGVFKYHSNGSLDSTFDSDGIVTTKIGANDGGYKCAFQPDGKIVVVGWIWDMNKYDNIAVIRYNKNGSLDTSFGVGGIVSTDVEKTANKATSVAIQSDGKIVVSGYTSDTLLLDQNFLVLRYQTNGLLDSSFGINGYVITDFNNFDDRARATCIQDDGKIVVCGVTRGDFGIARYNVNGSLDSSFDQDGLVITDFGTYDDQPFAMAIGSDGKIVVSGHVIDSLDKKYYDFAVARYLSKSNNSIQTIVKNNTSIYPNPFTQFIHIKGTKDNGFYRLFDMQGKLILQSKTLADETIINTEKVVPGIYILSHINGNVMEHFKIIKL